jgi:putative peptidoglycan lipid II flippase
MVRAFYAIKDTKTPVRVALVDFVINIVVSLILIRVLGVLGIVLASTTAIIVQAVLLERALVKRLPEMHFAPLIPERAEGPRRRGRHVRRPLGRHARGPCPGTAGRRRQPGTGGGPDPVGRRAYGARALAHEDRGGEELRVLLAKVPVMGKLFRPAL